MSNTVNTLSGNTHVPFSCQHCGACCRDVEEKIMLEPYDAYRLGRFLREREEIESIEDVYAKYAHAVMLSDGFPIFVLNTVGKEQCCIFLQDGNCSVYDARLKVCRLYPFTVDFGQRGKRFSYYQCLDKHAAHFRGGMVRINDWMYQNFSKVERDILDLEKDVLPKLGEYMRRLGPDGQKACLFPTLYYRYYNYDLESPFLEQFKRNQQALITELEQRLSKEKR